MWELKIFGAESNNLNADNVTTDNSKFTIFLLLCFILHTENWVHAYLIFHH